MISTAWVETVAREHFGIEGRAKALAGYESSNFLLEGGGVRYVLKAEPAAGSDDGAGLEQAVLAYLEEVDLGVAVPRQIPSRDGALRLHLSAGQENGEGEGRKLSVRCLSYLPGAPWAELQARPPELRRSLGAALGELDKALQGLRHPEARRRHPWDPAEAARHRPGVGDIPPGERRTLVEQAFQGFAALVAPRLGELPHSVIHGDANENNLLVSEEAEEPRLTGLIDFGDVTETVTVGEVAVAAAYGVFGEEDALAAAADVVAGYHGERPLIEAELDVLFPLLLSRLAVTVTMAAGHRAKGADDEYLYVSEEPAWNALERLEGVSPREARERFAAACGLGSSSSRGTSPGELLELRRRRIGPSLSVSYRQPLKIVRGRGQFLFDHEERPYLDLVNNVCHVGHCHPRVVEAGARQMSRLNTNTRYLYDGLTEYADRLCRTLPDPLSVCFFVCSGSEANELALRLARTHTGRKDLIVLDGAYHGHTSALIEISPYKFQGAGGSGRPEPHVHVVPMPDGYRGPFKGYGRETGLRYAEEVQRAIDGAKAPIGAFICEPVLGCGGQVIPPEGYLEAVYGHVREAGGICIADEVQVGFGRMGETFWAFELQGVVPDIVVLGKPIGNGHPMAAVITTPEIAASFDNGMEFFSTFGGNPVSCAIGMAVLDVIEEEGLQERASEVGGRLLEGFRDLARRHPLLGEVRGQGLFLGLELVRSRETLEPAAEETAEVVHRMKERGMLLSVDGPLHNVVKIKPPMVLTADDADMVVSSLDEVLEEVAGEEGARGRGQ